MSTPSSPQSGTSSPTSGRGHFQAYPVQAPHPLTFGYESYYHNRSVSDPDSKDNVGAPRTDAVTTEEEEIEWQRGDCIGKGSFGKVYMALNTKNGQIIAVKQCALEDVAGDWQKEVNFLKRLRHPNIVALLGTQTKKKSMYIFMEYVPGNSLEALLSQFGKLNELVIRSYARQLLLALDYCHTNHVMHRDLKGKNVLVDQHGNVKLADFGSAVRFEDVVSSNNPNFEYNFSAPWVAPEVIGLNNRYDCRVDIWSLGCVVIEMATGEVPWSEITFQTLASQLCHIEREDAMPKIPERLSESGQDFVRKCLNRNAKERPHAHELLQHPWVCDRSIMRPYELFASATYCGGPATSGGDSTVGGGEI